MLYVATGNAGKLRDFATAAEAFHREQAGAAFQLAALPGLETIPAPEETAPTFEGNAREKAIYYSRHLSGAMVIADDSGLEVEALHGAPGVYSARYAQRAGLGSIEGRSPDGANNRHLLAELERVLTPQGLHASLDHRAGRYRCVLAAARDGQVLAAADGVMNGKILLVPRGAGGFGYDPLFYLPALDRTMAEIDQLTRLRWSHRGQALRALLPELVAFF
jgi:XTP/dITP diphosphohydrolase